MRSKIIVLAVPILALSAYMMFASQGLGPDLIPILPGEVEVDSKGHLHIPRVDTVVDAGLIVHPDRVRAQFEGAATFGATTEGTRAI